MLNKKNNLHNLKLNRKPTFFRITNRLINFLFSFSIVLFLFYVAGNYQLFLDQSQKIILTVLSYISIALIWFCCCGLIEIIFFSIKKKTFYFVRFIPLYILFAGFGVVNAAVGTFITYASH